MKLGRFILVRILLIGLQIFGISAVLFSVYALSNYDVGVGHVGLAGLEAVKAENEALGTNYTYTDQFFNFWEGRLIGDCDSLSEAAGNLFSGKDCGQTFGVSWESDTDFGRYRRYAPFDDVIIENAISSILLFVIAFVVYAGISTFLGVVAALYEKRLIDSVLRILTSIGTAVPAILVTDFIIRVGRDPQYDIIQGDIPAKISQLNIRLFVEVITSNMFYSTYTSGFDVEQFMQDSWYLLYPIMAMVIISTSFLFRIIRALFIEELRKSYVRTAKSKGLSRNQIIRRHVLPNIMPRIINTFAVTIPISLTNAAIVEYMFKYNGLANMLISSSSNFNFPVLHAGGLIFVFFSSTLMLVNDIFVGMTDKVRSD